MKKVFVCCALVLAGLFAGSEVMAASTCKIKAVVASGKGKVTGSGTYTVGKTAVIKATPASGYRFLRWESCCRAIDTTSTTLKYKIYEKYPETVYAYFKKKPSIVKPAAADGKSSLGVKLTWKKASGAVSYKIRRGKSSTYSKSSVIWSGNDLSYFDYSCPEEANSSGKFYYWVMSVDSTGKAFASKAKYDVGYPKNLSKIYGPSTVGVGKSETYMVSSNCSPERKGSFGWKIVSGGTCATISSTGYLKAKRAGTVVIQAKYRGKTMKKTVKISKSVPDCTNCSYTPVAY